MADNVRLSKVLRELNISIDRAVDFLESKKIEIEKRPTTKISAEVYELLSGEFQTDATKKVASKELGAAKLKEKEALRIKREQELEEKLKKEAEAKKIIKAKTSVEGPKTVGKIDLNIKNESIVKEFKPLSVPKSKEDKEQAAKVISKKAQTTVDKSEDQNAASETSTTANTGKVETNYAKLSGPKSTGETIDLSKFNKPMKAAPSESADLANNTAKRKRRRISKVNGNNSPRSHSNKARNQSRSQTTKVEPTAEEVQKQVRETLEKLQGKSSKGKGAKYRRDKRDQHRQQTEKEIEQQAIESKTLKVTEFVTANEVASMMDVSVTEIISACMSLGMMVTMNQRLDAETLTIVAEEFGYTVDFVTADIDEAIEEVLDNVED